jgi:DNA replication and repair protein RecF
MYLTHLSLTDFRIFSRFDHNLPKNSLILVGDNAQGKTSLLEAVYYLSTLDSFQATSTVDLINFSALQNDLAVSRIVADYQKGKLKHNLEIRIIRDILANGNSSVRKEVILDGNQLKVSAAIGHFNAVLFLPHMLQITTGSPQLRRQYLNLTIAQIDQKYSESLSEYNKALIQRNALLKQLNERTGDVDQLSYWDEIITQSGSYLIFTRIQTIRELEQIAAVIHQELTRGEEILRLNYNPSYEPITIPPNQIELPLDNPVDRSSLELSEIQVGFREQIVSQRKEEILRGMTTIGPHRDDLRFLSNGIDLGNFGSRGQLRTTLLSIKLAEVAWLKEKTGHWPVLLLDEVLAELDDTRRNDLLERLSKTEQSLLTTTDLNLFAEEYRNAATTWRIQNGQLSV